MKSKKKFQGPSVPAGSSYVSDYSLYPNEVYSSSKHFERSLREDSGAFPAKGISFNLLDRSNQRNSKTLKLFVFHMGFPFITVHQLFKQRLFVMSTKFSTGSQAATFNGSKEALIMSDN